MRNDLFLVLQYGRSHCPRVICFRLRLPNDSVNHALLPLGVVGAHGEAMISHSTREWGLSYIEAPSRVLVN